MALLVADRDTLWGALQRWWSNAYESIGFLKAEGRAAVDATDDWLDANQVSYNQALPAAFRGKATLAQKTLLLCLVAMKRAGLGTPGE